jgi:hypothetical protein
VFAKETIDYEVRISLYEDTQVYQAIEWCEMYRSKFAFIMNADRQLLGYVAADILYEVDEQILAAEFMQPVEEKLILREETHFFDILRKAELADNYIFPVITLEEEILGYCTPDSLIKAFSRDNELLHKGGIIVLEIDLYNYSLSEIARIVESNDAVILNVSVKRIPLANKLQITLKINKTDLKNIQATFERFEYTTVHTIHQSEYDIQLQERVDNLLKYLEV